MKPDIWGPTAWNYIHFLSFSRPDNPTKKILLTINYS